MKNIHLLVIACLLSSASFSQSFMHGAGISIFVTKVESSDIAAYGGFTYSPRIRWSAEQRISFPQHPLHPLRGFAYTLRPSR